MIVHISLTDEQIYSISLDNVLYSDCLICKCIICSKRQTCRNCYICAVTSHPVFKCDDMVYKIFSVEPYKSYINEIDEINKAKEWIKVYNPE